MLNIASSANKELILIVKLNYANNVQTTAWVALQKITVSYVKIATSLVKKMDV